MWQSFFKIYKEHFQHEILSTGLDSSKDPLGKVNSTIENSRNPTELPQGDIILDIREKQRGGDIELLEDKTAFVEHTTFVDPRLNRHGNYSHYVDEVFKTIMEFPRIDFMSKVREKMVVLPEIDHNKITLILDLDETLIHTDFHCQYGVYDKVLEFTYEGDIVNIPLIIRPGAKKFLTFIQDKFNVLIFTAGKKEYADAILNYLDPENNVFKYRFYRDDCISLRNKVFIKDLRIFQNLDLQRTIIIDNSLYSFANQLSNGILITSFYNNKKDYELLNLVKYLENLAIQNVQDVRVSNEAIFNFERLHKQMQSKEQFVKNF